MAYNTAENRAEYTATSGQITFPFSFKVYEDSDIKVYITPDGDTASDTNDIKTLNVDYTVTVDGDNGGSIDLIVGATLNDKITVLRNLPIKRDTDYQTNGDLLADTLNQDQNYQTYLIGDQDGRQDRYVQLPESAQNVSGTLPAPEADQYIRWNDSGDALVNDGTYPSAIQTAVDAAAEAEGYRDTVVAKEALVNPHYGAIDSIAAVEVLEDMNILANPQTLADIEAVAGIADIIEAGAGTAAGTTTQGMFQHNKRIASDKTITEDYNAISAGPVTVDEGVTVTVPEGSTWVIC
jgi:hypothetical protein